MQQQPHHKLHLLPLSSAEDGVGDGKSGSGGWVRVRVVLLVFMAIVLGYLSRVNLSIAAVQMQDLYHWTDSEKGLLLSGFFYGYILSQMPGSWLTYKVTVTSPVCNNSFMRINDSLVAKLCCCSVREQAGVDGGVCRLEHIFVGLR